MHNWRTSEIPTSFAKECSNETPLSHSFSRQLLARSGYWVVAMSEDDTANAGSQQSFSSVSFGGFSMTSRIRPKFACF